MKAHAFKPARASSISGPSVKNHRWATGNRVIHSARLNSWVGERVFSGRFPEPPATRPLPPPTPTPTRRPTAGPQQALADTTTASVPRCTRCFSSPRSRPMAKRLAAAEKEVGASRLQSSEPGRPPCFAYPFGLLPFVRAPRCSSRWCGSRRRTASEAVTAGGRISWPGTTGSLARR